jgi:hypothetical protein
LSEDSFGERGQAQRAPLEGVFDTMHKFTLMTRTQSA